MTFSTSKDPQADLDYSIDWSLWLGADTIAASTWSAPATSGLLVHSPSVNLLATIATAWISGGTPGAYRVTNRITTASGRVDERSINVTVEQR